MNKQIKTLSGLSVAMAAAALFMSAPLAAQTAEKADTGHCMGANACKGKGACKSANNACKGQNACKGKGFTETSEAQCKDVGGHFEKPQAKTDDAKPAEKKY